MELKRTCRSLLECLSPVGRQPGCVGEDITQRLRSELEGLDRHDDLVGHRGSGDESIVGAQSHAEPFFVHTLERMPPQAVTEFGRPYMRGWTASFSEGVRLRFYDKP